MYVRTVEQVLYAIRVLLTVKIEKNLNFIILCHTSGGKGASMGVNIIGVIRQTKPRQCALKNNFNLKHIETRSSFSLKKKYIDEYKNIKKKIYTIKNIKEICI